MKLRRIALIALMLPALVHAATYSWQAPVNSSTVTDDGSKKVELTVSGTAIVTITMQDGTPPPPPPPPAPDSADLCSGLIQDKAAHPMSAIAKPTKGQSITDPEFGTKIVRITDVQADLGSKVAKPAYSTMPAWNADESYLILYVTNGAAQGHYLYNGKTYQFIRKLDIQPTDIEHFAWSSTDPDILFYTYAWEMSGTSLRQIVKYHVSTGQKDVVYNIPNSAAPGAYRVDMGGDPIYTSWNNDLFGLRRRGSSDTGFTYRISTSTESPRVAGGAPQIAPSGKYYVFGRDVMDTATNAKVRTMISDTTEHGDITMLANGQDVWVSNQFDVQPYGTLIAENLVTGVVTPIISESNGYPYPPVGTHISGHAFKKPGWIGLSVTGDPNGQTLLSQEVLLADINTNKVCRVAHHRSAGSDGPNGYWAEPHINISPSGTRLLFGSDWGGGATVDAYVVELPSYQPQ